MAETLIKCSWYILIHLNIFAKHYIVDVWQGSENTRVLNMPSYTLLQTSLNVSEQWLNMPKHTLICQNKKSSKNSRVSNMSHAIACIYTLVYSEPWHTQSLRHNQNPVKDFRLTVKFWIPCNQRSYQVK